jgi:hypothetical protein
MHAIAEGFGVATLLARPTSGSPDRILASWGGGGSNSVEDNRSVR